MAPADRKESRLIWKVFIALQVADVLTTLLGIRLGAVEASPFVRALIHSSSPTTGLLACKLIALAIAAIALTMRRPRVIKLANIGFSALVLWNAAMIGILVAR